MILKVGEHLLRVLFSFRILKIPRYDIFQNQFKEGITMSVFTMCVICVLLGIIGGVLITKLLSLTRPYDGYLRVDRSDEAPMLFLEINTSVEELSNRSEVRFKVKNEDFLPRK